MVSPMTRLAGFLTLALGGTAALLLTPTPALAQLVGITRGMDPALYAINPAAGMVTDLGAVGDGGITAFTQDGSTLLAGDENGDLLTVDPTSGATTLLGSPIGGDANAIQGLAVLNDAVYGLQLDDTGTLDLYNYTTDTLIGAADNNGLSGAQGLTVLNGSLVTADAFTGAGGFLYSLDPGTATAATLDTTGGTGAGLPLNGLSGLAAVGGTLYASNNDSYTPDYGVYQVDPGTAASTEVVNVTAQTLRLGSIAAFTASAPAPFVGVTVSAVPEPSPLALLAVAAVPLGLLAVARRPARKAAGLMVALGLVGVTLPAHAQFTPAGNNPYTTPAANPTASLPQPPNNATATATNPLVTGKSLTLPPLGTQTNVGSLPLNLVVSPDGKYAVSSDMGFREFLVAVNAATGKETSGLDFNGANPAYATASAADQALTTNQEGLYYGLAFNPAKNADGTYTLYAAQGNENTIAVLKLDPSGILTDTKVRFHGATPSVTVASIPPTSTTSILSAIIDQQAGLPTTYPVTLQQAFKVKPVDTPSGLALDAHGYLYVANNDTALPFAPAGVSIYNTNASPPVEVGRYTFPATPAGTNYPFSLAVLPDGSKVFVGSERDGLVYVLSTTGSGTFTTPTGTTPPGIGTGSHPLGLTLSADHSKLFVANAQSDTISVVSTATDAVTATVLLRPQGALSLPGVTPDALALSPDGKTLYATLADMNAVAVIDATRNRLLGYVPVGWYPTAVVASASNTLLVTNAKGNYTRYPNPTYGTTLAASNPIPTYNENMIEGDVQTIAVPTAAQLARDTALTLADNKITPTTDDPTSNPLVAIGLPAGKIKHVLYIVKENRTYDQILGDLKDGPLGVTGNPLGNGDAGIDLDSGGKLVTPNLHALARRFVLLDNYFEGGEVSEDGWNWSDQGMANEFTVRNVPYNYSGRQDFTQTDFQGQNNGNIVGGFPSVAQTNPQFSLLYPGGAAPITDIAQNAGGYIWDDFQKVYPKLGYRNYGVDGSTGAPGVIPDNYPTHAGQREGGHDGGGRTDLDFRHFDTNYPDSEAGYYYDHGQFPALTPGSGTTEPTYGAPPATASDPNALFNETAYGTYNAPSRFSEFRREFGEMLARDPTGGTVPAFMTMTLMSDHTQGSAANTATSRIHTPESMIADDDYGVGQVVQLLSSSAVWDSTAIFVIEDDSQDGPDHVDCHRSICFVLSPWIKANSVDHNFYNTDSVLHTMEDLLGLPAMNQYDAIAPVISDWDTAPSNSAPYAAILPAQNLIDELNPTATTVAKLDHNSAQYKLTLLASKMDFTHPDAAPEDLLNAMIWKSVKGWDSPVPVTVHKAQLADSHTPGKAKAKTAGDDDDH